MGALSSLYSWVVQNLGRDADVASAAGSLHAKIKDLRTLVDDLETRLSAVRAVDLDDLTYLFDTAIGAAVANSLLERAKVLGTGGAGELTGPRAAKLDNLDALVSSRLGVPILALAHYIGEGADATVAANTTIDIPVKVYRDLTINAGIVLTAGFSPQVVICRTLGLGSTTSQVSANGRGGAGGAGGVAGTPVGGDGVPAGEGAANASGAVRAVDGILWSNGGTQGLANGGAGAAGVAAKGYAGLLHLLESIGRGGGGGGGGAREVAPGGQTGGYGAWGVGGGGGGGGSPSAGTPTGGGGAGGAGGGDLILLCDDIITAAGLITANGVNGANATAGEFGNGGGGGGGGGRVLVFCRKATVVPTLQANGGTGGAAVGTGGAGANGGSGFSRLLRREA